MYEVWFWQRIISPHMARLSVELARLGCRVTYVAEKDMSQDRARQGWVAPELPGVTLRYMQAEEDIEALMALVSDRDMHVCEGLRANGLVRVVQIVLKRRGYSFWVAMESLDDPGARGIAKRALYRYLFWRNRNHLKGVLAIGHDTSKWIEKRGVPAGKVFQFAYFLADAPPSLESEALVMSRPFKLLFVGRLIKLKRVDLLIEALSKIKPTYSNFLLQIIGDGPQEETLRTHANRILGPNVEWFGLLPMHEVRIIMSQADCLVLPSRYDGWGAVVSEALMAGTPAICSDRCGAAEVVIASGEGGVFRSGDLDHLAALLAKRIAEGRQSSRARVTLSCWARSLGAEAGARYLMDIFLYRGGAETRPTPPWRQSLEENCHGDSL